MECDNEFNSSFSKIEGRDKNNGHYHFIIVPILNKLHLTWPLRRSYYSKPILKYLRRPIQCNEKIKN